MKYLHKLDNKELTLSVFMTRSWDNSDSYFFQTILTAILGSNL